MRLECLGFILIPLAAACDTPASRDSDTGHVASQGFAMPVIEYFTTIVNDESPDELSQPVAVSSHGSVVFSPLLDAGEYRLRILDSSGLVISRLGHRGRGPGEIQTPAWLMFDSRDNLIVYDMALLRLTIYRQDGQVVLQHQSQGPVFPFALHGDSLDLSRISSEGLLEIGRMSLSSGETRIVINSRDSMFRSEFAEPFMSQAKPEALPARTSTRDFIALGDGLDYRIYVYSSRGKLLSEFGRDLQPRHPSERHLVTEENSLRKYRGQDGRSMDPVVLERMISDIRASKLPHFSHLGGIAYDSTGRLWVVGIESDSGFADVFDGDAHLGRLALSCPGFSGRWSMNGNWLAMTCAAPDSLDRDAVIRLFRIKSSR
jgi:hypothetical protein